MCLKIGIITNKTFVLPLVDFSCFLGSKSVPSGTDTWLSNHRPLPRHPQAEAEAAKVRETPEELEEMSLGEDLGRKWW